MKLQLDTATKTIKVDETVNLGELVKHLEKLLPKDSPFGHWKDYKIETNTIWLNTPITVSPYQPIHPYNPIPFWWQNIGAGSYCDGQVSNVTYLNPDTPITQTVFNLQLN